MTHFAGGESMTWGGNNCNSVWNEAMRFWERRRRRERAWRVGSWVEGGNK